MRENSVNTAAEMAKSAVALDAQIGTADAEKLMTAVAPPSRATVMPATSALPAVKIGARRMARRSRTTTP